MSIRKHKKTIRETRFAESVAMSNPIHEAIYRINVKHDLSEDEAYNVFREVLSISNDVERGILMGILLNGLMAKTPTVEEAVGFIRAALSVDGNEPHQIPQIDIGSKNKVITLAGSGKKAIKTTNISSCAAIVAASLGVFVAKPCSKGTSSVSGSSDFMEEIGANLEISSDEMVKVMEKTKLGFFKIEGRISKFDSLYGGKFHAPHILSLGLAAMILPFKSHILLYGLSHPNISLSAKVFKKLGYDEVMVVSSTDNGIHFFDEVGVFGSTSMIGIRGGVLGNIKIIQPGDLLKLPRYDRFSIRPGRDVSENVKKSLDALSGKKKGAIVDMICVNAATILYLGGKAVDMESGYVKAKKAIESGLAIKKIKEFVAATGGGSEALEGLLKGKA